MIADGNYPRNMKYFMMVLCVLVISYFLPKQPRFRYEFEKGKEWNNKDLVSAYTFGILKTNPEMATDKKKAIQNVPPIYIYDETIGQAEIEAFQTEFDIKWNSSGLPESTKLKVKQRSTELLKNVYAKGIIGIIPKHSDNLSGFILTLVKQNVSQKVNSDDLYTAQSALYYIKESIKNKPLAEQKLVSTLIEDHIQPNINFDERLTKTIQESTVNSISTTRGMVQKGEVIVTRGSVVDEETYQKLLSFKEIYESQARSTGNPNFVFFGQILLVTFIISLLMIFLYMFRKDIFANTRQLILLLIIITFMLLALTWAIKLNLSSLYYIPFCIVPIIIRILFDTRLALYLHLLVVLIAGFFVPNSFEFVFYQITAGMVAIYSIRNLLKREQLLISAVFILISYFISFTGISLLREGYLADIEWDNFIPFLFSVLLTLLAYPLIYGFEKIFGITSDIALIELTNTNSRLLRELAFKAPGTFQHSLQVANLAEAAIFKIGGNSLLVRAGALYHDIGKIENPQYFIENQTTEFNPHDKVSYEKSAQIIIQHVYKGIEICRKSQIPESIIDFIRTHHGDTRVDYFYQSHLKNSPDEFVDENTFRYPGPIPFSKEQGVLMLADSVEAASRSLKIPDSNNIDELVERIISYKLDQQQLNNCDLTLKDIETIKLIFKSMLKSIYHVRIDYIQT